MDYFRNSMGPVEKCFRDSGIDKRNVHDVALIVGSARIPIVQKMIQEFFTELIVLSRHTHRNRVAVELGRQDYVTGEMWKNKSPFRLAVNIASITLDVESRGSTTLVQLWPWTWKCVSQRWKTQPKPAFKLPGKLPRIPMEPFPVYPSGKSRDEAFGKMGSGQKFYHNVTPRADFTARGQ